MSQSLSILGSTGTIGCNTLRIIDLHPERFEIIALTAGNNVERLIEQAKRYTPKHVVITNEAHFATLKEALAGLDISIAAGEDAVSEAASMPADIIMSAIVGAAALRPTLTAIKQGTRVALANKESLVCAGTLMMDAVTQSGAALIPVDSEHNAIFQLQPNWKNIDKVTLTASGGPFRDFTQAQMAQVTPAQAVKHPNWNMGAKISIDSATMANKALELIEAKYLFNLPANKLDAIIHPQSIVHCLLAMRDGSVLSQLSDPDMCTPIACALAWPERIAAPTKTLDLTQLGSLTFQAVDTELFPAMRVVKDVLNANTAAAIIFNAANEVAVQAFIDGAIGFLDIVSTTQDVLAQSNNPSIASIEDVVSCDAEARACAANVIKSFNRKHA